jgi:hypothetical protein
MASPDPDAYDVAIAILDDLPQSLADRDLTDNDPTDVAVVVSRQA